MSVAASPTPRWDQNTSRNAACAAMPVSGRCGRSAWARSSRVTIRDGISVSRSADSAACSGRAVHHRGHVLGLIFCLAEMSPALPHTGAAYSFARSAMGPWGGIVTGLAESIEYILTPAVIVFFIGSYLTAIFETAPEMQPLWWLGGYVVFIVLNICGVELSFRVSVIVTVARARGARGVLGQRDSALRLLALGAEHRRRPGWQSGRAPEGRRAVHAVRLERRARGLPFAVWLFLAIEQLPLAAEESPIPKKRHAEGPHLRHGHVDRLGDADHVPQLRHRRHGGRADAWRVLARHLRRAAARWLPRHLSARASRSCWRCSR